jgi:hypothetical protein
MQFLLGITQDISGLLFVVLPQLCAEFADFPCRWIAITRKGAISTRKGKVRLDSQVHTGCKRRVQFPCLISGFLMLELELLRRLMSPCSTSV